MTGFVYEGSMPKLLLSLLGLFRVELAGEPLVHIASVRVRALLAYLAVERDRPHARESLGLKRYPYFNLKYEESAGKKAAPSQMGVGTQVKPYR